MARYENKQDGLTIIQKGSIILVMEKKDGKDEEKEKMNLGDAQYAAEIALDLAHVLRASEVKEETVA